MCIITQMDGINNQLYGITMVPLLTMNARRVWTGPFTDKLLPIPLTGHIPVTLLLTVAADTWHQRILVTLILTVAADTLLHQIVATCTLLWMPMFTLGSLAIGHQHCQLTLVLQALPHTNTTFHLLLSTHAPC
jgi:hypothetical protein